MIYWWMRKPYGQLQLDADAGTQPPVQMGWPEMLNVSAPSCTAEQKARPKALIPHSPGPQRASPWRVNTIPPYGGEQAITPLALVKHLPPGGGQTVFPLTLLTQGFCCSLDQDVAVNKGITIRLIVAIRAALFMRFPSVWVSHSNH